MKTLHQLDIQRRKAKKYSLTDKGKLSRQRANLKYYSENKEELLKTAKLKRDREKLMKSETITRPGLI